MSIVSVWFLFVSNGKHTELYCLNYCLFRTSFLLIDLQWKCLVSKGNFEGFCVKAIINYEILVRDVWMTSEKAGNLALDSINSLNRTLDLVLSSSKSILVHLRRHKLMPLKVVHSLDEYASRNLSSLFSWSYARSTYGEENKPFVSVPD